MKEAVPSRRTWKQDLAPYLEIDRRRSLAQLASVILPYLGVWMLAVVVQPPAWLAVALGLLATVFLIRMYSLFHDLTHNSMFESRAANSRWGHALGDPERHAKILIDPQAQNGGDPRYGRSPTQTE